MGRIALDDADLVAAINRLTGAGLVVRGRSASGKLGGAVFVDWPDGRPGVVTIFQGSLDEAEAVAGLLNDLRDRGLPVPRHERVVDLGDQVAFVQERLPAGPSRPLNPRRIDAMVEINERFAGALTHYPGVPPVEQWFRADCDGPQQIISLVPQGDHRAADVVGEIIRLTTSPSSVQTLAGTDLVHVDLSAANVLFDADDAATAVVDWNLGTFRGNRRVALVQARFDREWFVRRPDATTAAVSAARRLDQVLEDVISPDTLRIYWAFWLRHQLSKAFRSGSEAVIDWQLQLAESRLQ